MRRKISDLAYCMLERSSKRRQTSIFRTSIREFCLKPFQSALVLRRVSKEMEASAAYTHNTNTTAAKVIRTEQRFEVVSYM